VKTWTRLSTFYFFVWLQKT